MLILVHERGLTQYAFVRTAQRSRQLKMKKKRRQELTRTWTSILTRLDLGIAGGGSSKTKAIHFSTIVSSVGLGKSSNRIVITVSGMFSQLDITARALH